jgi:hypothetical protein
MVVCDLLFAREKTRLPSLYTGNDTCRHLSAFYCNFLAKSDRLKILLLLLQHLSKKKAGNNGRIRFIYYNHLRMYNHDP